MNIKDVVNKLIIDFNPLGNEIIWIGIAGIPGSGKSTIASKCEQVLKKDHNIEAFVLSLDGYHYYKKSLEQFKDSDYAIYHRGAPFTFDLTSLIYDLKNARYLKRSVESVYRFPSFDHALGDPVENSLKFEPKKHKVVIVEGLYLLYWSHLDALFHQTWFIDAKIETCIERVTLRNSVAFTKAFNETWTIEKTRDRVLKVDKNNMELVYPTRSKANIIINNESFIS